MEVAGAANIGMVDHRRVLGLAGTPIELVGEDRGDAFVVERADLDGAGRDGLGPGGIEALKQPEHAETGAEALLWVGPIGQHGDDQPFGARPDRARPAPEPLRRPFGVAPMRTRHVIGIGAVPAAAIAALMRGDASAAVEHLDRAGRDADVDLLADQRMRHRVEEALDLDVIVEPDPGETPFGELVVRLRQRLEGRPLDTREQIVPADAQAAHDVAVDAPEHNRNRGIDLASEKKVWCRSRPRM